MNDWWNALTGLEQFYWTVAIAASIVFFFVFIVNLIVGFDTDTDMDGDVDIDMDGSADASVSVTLFSFKGLTAFFTFFGWAGVLFLKDGETAIMASAYAFITGSLALIAVGYLMQFFANMGESGTYSIKEALNKEGEVYLTIPASVSGKGKVQLELGGGLKEIDAISDQGEIKTGSKILVTDIVDKETILVQIINE